MGIAVQLQTEVLGREIGPESRIASATVVGPHRLRLMYADGASFELDFQDEIEAGGVMTALADPAIFAAVKVVRRGRAIEFPGEIDFCADSLRLDGEALHRG